MSAGFTPGPWKVAASDKHRVIVDGGESAGLDIAGAIKFVPQYQSKSIANARLIAAAPELYDALENAVAFIAVWAGTYQSQYGLDAIHPSHAEALAKTQAALAKARGQ